MPEEDRGPEPLRHRSARGGHESGFPAPATPGPRRPVPGRVLLLLLVAGCASGGGPAPDAAPSAAEAGAGPQRVNSPWPIRTRAHVDLWLHGFAMVQDDTTQVPYFRPGYRERMVARKNSQNVATLLESNREQLRARLAVNRDLVGAQFLALQFENWDVMQQAIQYFLVAEGNPGRASNPEIQNVIATFASIFPAAADREWLRTFVLSLRDEETKFYRAHWLAEHRDRERVILRLDSLWENDVRPKLTRYLNNTQLQRGEFLLSMPLDGEGRTLTGARTVITTTYPETPDAAIEAIYVFMHEAIIPVSSVAVNDNTTPAEKRAGLAERYTSAAAVIGGGMLLERIAPELAPGYARYYLRSTAAGTVGADPEAALARTFQLPAVIRDAMSRQLDLVLGGI